MALNLDRQNNVCFCFFLKFNLELTNVEKMIAVSLISLNNISVVSSRRKANRHLPLYIIQR